MFWDLASLEEAVRRSAMITLTATFGDTPAGDEVLGMQAYLNDRNTKRIHAQNLSYCMRRLVRGLASSRDAARQGFGAALAKVAIPTSSFWSAFTGLLSTEYF